MIHNGRSRRLLLVLGTLAMGIGVGGTATSAAPPRPADTATDQPSSSDEAPIVGARPSISDDGRWVVYAGAPTDGSSRASTVYLRDLEAPTTPATELTTVPDRVHVGDSVRPVITADGCAVFAITQLPYDQFRDDDLGARWDVYKLLLPRCGGTAGDWELVSTTNDDTGETTAMDRVSPDDAPAVNGSGSLVAFTHQARPGKDPLLTVSLVDLTIPVGQAGRSRALLGTPPDVPDTTFRYHGQRQPAMSADGKVIAFVSDARADQNPPVWGAGPVPGDYATSQVYVWDRAAITPSGTDGLVHMASAVPPTSGATTALAQVVPADTGAADPAVSRDGHAVVFDSASTNLAGGTLLPGCAGACPSQVFRYELASSGLLLVSKAPDPNGGAASAADRGAWAPAVNADGTQVAFVTKATNLFPTVSAADGNVTDGDIVVADVELGSMHRASLAADGQSPAPATNGHPVLSTLGDVVVFDTLSASTIDPTADPNRAGRQVIAVHRAPTIAIPDLDVGTVAVGFAGAEWYIGVKNLGPSTFVPATVTSSASEFAITGGSCQNGTPVPPGQSCSVNITLTPAVEGPISGTLTVTGAGAHPIVATAKLSGSGGEPLLAPAPAGADFPPTLVGTTSRSVSFDITNVGFSVGDMSSVTLSGADPQDFTIVSQSCVGQSMIPGASCAVEVAFKPSAAGYRTATVLVGTATGQYTGIIVDGSAAFRPTIQLADDTVVAGRTLGVGGTGFEPRATITIGWSDGWGTPMKVTTDAQGSFLVSFPTRYNDRAGARQIVVQGSGAALTAPVRVLKLAAEDGPGSAVWGG